MTTDEFPPGVRKTAMKHPLQPIEIDKMGTLRFKQNSIVRHLLDAGPFDMNQLAMMRFSDEDREQFAQLIGYSLGGFGELGYVSIETYNTAESMSSGDVTEEQARIASLEEMLRVVREGLRNIVPAVFNIHEDDLEP